MSRPKPDNCECCDFETEALKLYPQMDTTIGGGGKTVNADFWWCDLCTGTIASVAHRYPGSYPDANVLRSLCYIGNVLRKEIRSNAPHTLHGFGPR